AEARTAELSAARVAIRSCAAMISFLNGSEIKTLIDRCQNECRHFLCLVMEFHLKTVGEQRLEGQERSFAELLTRSLFGHEGVIQLRDDVIGAIVHPFGASADLEPAEIVCHHDVTLE